MGAGPPARLHALRPPAVPGLSSKGAPRAGRHHILWTGCKANETSADAWFGGRYNGAFTYHFVKVMKASKNKLSRKEVVAEVRALMKGQFVQNPQLEGNASNRSQAIAY